MPTAVLLVPSVLRFSAAAPTAVFWEPVVLAVSANEPNAVFAKPVREAKKGVLSFCSVEVGIASVRRRDNRLRFWHKREAEQREYDEKWWSCFELNQWIHRCYLSFSRWLTLRLRGLKEGKKTPRGALLPYPGFRSVLIMVGVRVVRSMRP